MHLGMNEIQNLSRGRRQQLKAVRVLFYERENSG